jgi:hypothetical protein
MRGRLSIVNRPELVLGLLTLALHLWVNGSYGYFRDELYYIACGRHAAFGYTDQPPLIPLIAWASDAAFHSLRGLRLVPAVACAATVALTAHAAPCSVAGHMPVGLPVSRFSAAERWNSGASHCRQTACSPSHGWRSGSAS